MSLYLRQAESNPAIVDKKAVAQNQTLADLETWLEKSPGFRRQQLLAHFCFDQKRYDKALPLFQGLLAYVDSGKVPPDDDTFTDGTWERQQFQSYINQMEKASKG